MAACEKWFCAVKQEVVAKHLEITPSFLPLFSSIMKWWSHLTKLTSKIDVFCLSWTLSSCSWSLLSNWTSGDTYFLLDLLTEFWPDTNILLFPVAFHKRFLFSSKSSLPHLRIIRRLCISTRTFVVVLVYLELNKWNSCQARVYLYQWFFSCFWNNVLASSSCTKSV